MLKRTCLWMRESISRTRDPVTGRRHPLFCLTGFLYCCNGSNGIIRGCPDQRVRGCLGCGSFEEIWKTGFRRYRGQRVVCEGTLSKVFSGSYLSIKDLGNGYPNSVDNGTENWNL